MIRPLRRIWNGERPASVLPRKRLMHSRRPPVPPTPSRRVLLADALARSLYDALLDAPILDRTAPDVTSVWASNSSSFKKQTRHPALSIVLKVGVVSVYGFKLLPLQNTADSPDYR